MTTPKSAFFWREWEPRIPAAVFQRAHDQSVTAQRNKAKNGDQADNWRIAKSAPVGVYSRARRGNA